MRTAFFRVVVYCERQKELPTRKMCPNCLRMSSSACFALPISAQARPPPTSLCTPFHSFQRIALRTRYRDIEDTGFECWAGCGWHWRSMWFLSLADKFQNTTFKNSAAISFQILNIQHTWPSSYFIWRIVNCNSSLSNWRIKKPTRCHLIFYCTSYMFNMFRALVCPSSGAPNYDVVYHIGRVVLGLLCVGGEVQLGWSSVWVAGSSTTSAWACNPDTTPAYPHLTSNIQQTKNETTNVVINIIVASSWWWA